MHATAPYNHQWPTFEYICMCIIRICAIQAFFLCVGETASSRRPESQPARGEGGPEEAGSYPEQYCKGTWTAAFWAQGNVIQSQCPAFCSKCIFSEVVITVSAFTTSILIFLFYCMVGYVVISAFLRGTHVVVVFHCRCIRAQPRDLRSIIEVKHGRCSFSPVAISSELWSSHTASSTHYTSSQTLSAHTQM